ncbi:MAG: metal-sensing transcriptional repressor [Bacilli bacterium]
MNNCDECIKTKHRTVEEKNKITKRLSIVEGQVRGIKNMLEDDRYCSDILIQISAINNSLKSIGNIILKSHMESCMVEEIKKGNNEIIEEIIELFKRLD